MQYNVARGLREIIAPRQTMATSQWKHVLEEFGGLCIFCGSSGTAKNRGIVPDHLIPVTRFGELVVGNTVPACQTCNDSRGEKDWRPFLRSRHPGDAEAQILAVEAHLAKYNYHPASLESALAPHEQAAYATLLRDWGSLIERARALHAAAEKRRRSSS